MAIDFPDTPSAGDTHTVGSVSWEWDGTTWKSLGGGTNANQNIDGGNAYTQYGGTIVIETGNAGSF